MQGNFLGIGDFMNFNKTVYIHYGSKCFHKKVNFPIKNRSFGIKPMGGLWASRESSSFGWKEWCHDNNWECDMSLYFKFVLQDESRKYIISCLDDIIRLPLCDNLQCRWYCIDFEKCLEMGIDAIELCWYGEEYRDTAKDNLYMALYGWDCDSMIVLNPDSVVQI